MRNSWPEHSKKKLCFNWIPVTKVNNVWATKVQRSYLSWHCRVMQILKKNWLVVFKLTWGTFDPSTRKDLCFNWLLVAKVYNVSATNIQRSYLSWHWRVMQILKKILLGIWKMTWEIWRNFSRALENVKIGTLILFSKVEEL